jgi:hypothetical protein
MKLVLSLRFETWKRVNLSLLVARPARDDKVGFNAASGIGWIEGNFYAHPRSWSLPATA